MQKLCAGEMIRYSAKTAQREQVSIALRQLIFTCQFTEVDACIICSIVSIEQVGKHI
jgi:hypothetical protein